MAFVTNLLNCSITFSFDLSMFLLTEQRIIYNRKQISDKWAKQPSKVFLKKTESFRNIHRKTPFAVSF